MAGKKQGKPCPRHPELLGMRYVPSNSCVGCNTEYRHRKPVRRVTRADYQALTVELLAALTNLLTDATERDPLKWHEAKRVGRELIGKAKDVLQ